ncbi:IL-6 subfamily cytokine M17 [Hoplias malabaricus]|uniref:IL-6 subfamily cytokine M17 n=1 Tax=Hoplias malabaricus TaxID=27720 RepID=UPI003461F562
MQAHRLQATSMAFLLGAVLLSITDFVNTTVPCAEDSYSRILSKGVKLARLVNWTTSELIKTYQANQGDFAEQFCKMPMDNVPASTLYGQTSTERILNIYTRLKEFLPHISKVLEQQKDLQPPSCNLIPGIIGVKEQVGHLAHRVNCIFQILQPNVLVPEPSWPTRIPPAQNVFQQKVYGCVVLTRLREFLSVVVNELKSIKGSMRKKRIQLTSNNL